MLDLKKSKKKINEIINNICEEELLQKIIADELENEEEKKMLDKNGIETCKKEARNFIEFMETAGDNAGWTRGLLWHIEQLENKNKELNKGIKSLIDSRRKWKNRYYNTRRKLKEAKRQNTERIVSKQEFVEIINQLKEVDDFVKETNNKSRKLKDAITSDFFNASILSISHETSVIQLLEKMFNDIDMISYWIYELDYGRKYKDGMITENDGTIIDISTAEKLYDFLVENM